MVNIIDNEITTAVDCFNSSQLGQETLLISKITSFINFLIFLNIFLALYLDHKNRKAGETGIEPATVGFGIRCSPS